MANNQNNNRNNNGGNNRNNGGNNRNNGGNKPKEKFELPAGYLEGGYFLDSEQKKLRKEYITDFARKIAADLERDGGLQKNNKTQIRKFYEYGLRIKMMLQRCDNDISWVEAPIAEYISKVAYAKNRGLVTDLYEQFIVKNVKAIETTADFYAFMKHFEAIVAFMKK